MGVQRLSTSPRLDLNQKHNPGGSFEIRVQCLLLSTQQSLSQQMKVCFLSVTVTQGLGSLPCELRGSPASPDVL